MKTYRNTTLAIFSGIIVLWLILAVTTGHEYEHLFPTIALLPGAILCGAFLRQHSYIDVISMSLSKDIAHRMKRSLNPIAICAILLSNTGCQEQLGGGNRSFSVDGAPAKTAVFGIRAGSKLGFIIFTDNTEEGTIPDSWIPSWTGQIKPAKGLGVVYKGSNEGLDINGTAYKFANGRVFLVSLREDSISVTQLNVSNDDATYDAEIGRIAELKELQDFLRE